MWISELQLITWCFWIHGERRCAPCVPQWYASAAKSLSCSRFLVCCHCWHQVCNSWLTWSSRRILVVEFTLISNPSPDSTAASMRVVMWYCVASSCAKVYDHRFRSHKKVRLCTRLTPPPATTTVNVRTKLAYKPTVKLTATYWSGNLPGTMFILEN